jgi:hypothetical protein
MGWHKAAKQQQCTPQQVDRNVRRSHQYHLETYDNQLCNRTSRYSRATSVIIRGHTPSIAATDCRRLHAPAVAHALAVEYEVVLLLTAHEAKLVEEFRQDIRLCETDTEKFDRCLQKRDELLEENDRLVLRLAAFDHVMSAECCRG